MSQAEWWSWCFSGIFMMTGLLTGIWKYAQIRGSEQGRAHYYVDVAHRSALMYSFACVVLANFARMSVWGDQINLWAVIALLVFFGLSVASYIAHGFMQDTRNQVKKTGNAFKDGQVAIFMWALSAVEVGAFAILFTGFLKGQL